MNGTGKTLAVGHGKWRPGERQLVRRTRPILEVWDGDLSYNWIFPAELNTVATGPHQIHVFRSVTCYDAVVSPDWTVRLYTSHVFGPRELELLDSARALQTKQPSGFPLRATCRILR